jgi:two-component system NarL family response regulator
MDLRMPDLSGWEATEAIRRQFPQARILVLTTFDFEEDMLRALEAGAAGCLVKNIDGERLIATVRAVHAGAYGLPPEWAARLARRHALPDLSPRELEVLVLIVNGQSNKEIGSALGIAENAVKNHLKVILDKLGAADRTQAATSALRRGLVKVS